MIKPTGTYDIILVKQELIPKELLNGGDSLWELLTSGDIPVEVIGYHENLVTDFCLTTINGTFSTNTYYSSFDNYANLIFISQSAVNTNIDYRSKIGVMGFTLDYIGTPTSVVQSSSSWKGEFNFSVPGSPITINIIGLKTGSSTSDGNILSFIKLSTPITQTTSDLLFVRYTLQATYSNTSGMGGITNNWVQDRMNSSLLTNLMRIPNNHNWNSCMSRFLNPVTITNVCRNSSFINSSGFSPQGLSSYVDDIYKFKGGSLWSLDTSQVIGPHACAYIYNKAVDGSTADGFAPIFSINTQVQTPNIGTLFKHATGDSSLFSNPSSPPLSQGNLIVTGTSSVTSIFKSLAALITKTGDASDLISETFTVNVSNDELTVLQNWNNSVLGSVVTATVSSSGTLPAPLAPSTTYYIIFIDTTHIKLSTSESNALSNIWIDITTTGTGTHTITRTSTGKFKLSTNIYETVNLVHIDPPFLGANILNNSTYGLTNSDNNTGYIYGQEKLNWGVYVSPYMYFSRIEPTTTNEWICKWQFNTIESGISLVQVNTNNAIYANSFIWMATNTGLVKFDPSVDTVNYTYTVSDGLLATKCNDIVLDNITGKIWIAHDIGLTEYDPSSSTVIGIHTNGGGGTFNGMTNNQVKIYPAQLSAYDDIITWGGIAGITGTNTQIGSPRIYNKTTGNWVRIPFSNLVHTFSADPSTDKLTGGDWSDYDLVPLILTTTGTLPAPLTLATPYYLIFVDTNTIRVATSVANAIAGTYIDITTAGSGTHTATYTGYSNTGFHNSQAPLGDGTESFVSDVSTNNTLNFRTISVTLTGPGAGTFSITNSTDNNTPGAITGTFIPGKLQRISKDHFSSLFKQYNANINICDYRISTSNVSNFVTICGATGSYYPDTTGKRVLSSLLSLNGVLFIYYIGYLISTVTPQQLGWTGSAWSIESLLDINIPDATITGIMDGLNFNFENSGGNASNTQFISGENMMIVEGPGTIKSNLQTLTYKIYGYFADLHKITSRSITVPASAPYTYFLPESLFTDYLSLEDDIDYITILNGITPVTQVSNSPASGQYCVNTSGTFTADSSTDKLTISQDFTGLIGLPIRLSTNDTGTLAAPLLDGSRYYVIPVDSTHIKVANSYADALTSTNIDITTNGNGTQTMYPNGVFTFNSAQAGVSLTLSVYFLERH